MRVLTTVAELRRVLGARRPKARVGFVPTMGALHAGHVALINAARADVDEIVLSLFVNPTQFNDAADLARYPRQEARDLEIAAEAGVSVIFAPSAAEMYPPHHATSVHVEGAALGFEGDHRPGHFDGVATVCLKLFCLVEPDTAYFGQKDAQQIAVIRQLVRDANLDLDIRVVPTVRDADRLALSSRNVRLSPADRTAALAIPRALGAALAAHAEGRDPVPAARDALAGLDIEYVAVAMFDRQPTLVMAVKAGATRLIDNVPLDHPELAGLEAGGSSR